MQLIRYQQNITNCQQTFIHIKNTYIQNIDQGKWIVVTNKNIAATENCKNSKNTVIINGTYLVELTPFCSLKINDILLKEYKNSRNKFLHVPLPNINLNSNNGTIYNNIKFLNTHPVNFEKINEFQKEIELQKEENSKILNTPVYYYRTSFWTILLYIIMLILMFYYVYKYLWPKIKIFKSKNKKLKETEIII
jgi:hypothetical protein